MYIWVGIDVDSQLSDIKERVKTVESELKFEHSNFTLPFHISLKISFEIDVNKFDDVVSDIVKIYNDTESFNIDVNGIANETNICWIRMVENRFLIDLSQKINYLMLNKYNIPLHEYDLDYKFHTTLFMDNDTAKVDQAFNLVKDINVPKNLNSNRFLIGCSDTGKLGTYKVYKVISKI